MILWRVFNNIDINSYFSFSLWISSISSFSLRSVAHENITMRILSLNSFILKTLKEVQLKCELWDLFSYTEILINTDMLAFCLWLKRISSLFKWTIIINFRQNVHYLNAFDIAILNCFRLRIALDALASGALNAFTPKPPVPFILAGSAHCAPPKIKS